MANDAQGIGNLGSIFQNIQQYLNQRPVYNEEGKQIGTVPSRGEPARLYSETATGHQLSTDFMNRMKQDMVNKGKKAIVENAVNSGMVSPEDAHAFASNIPTSIIDMGIQQTGYGQGLQEMEKFMKQQGYRDPSLVSDISGKRAQKERNQKLQALAKGIKDYAMDPELEENPITGIRPEVYMQQLQKNPELVSDVIESSGFQRQGEITERGMKELSERLNNITRGIRETQNLTGVSDSKKALQQAQEILNTSNPVKTLSDPETRQNLERFRAYAQSSGHTGGEMYGLLNTITQTGSKKGFNLKESLGKATAALPMLNTSEMENRFENPEQRKKYFADTLSSVMEPESREPVKYGAAAKARLNALGFSDKAAENTVSSIIGEPDTARPEDLLEKVNQRYYPDKMPVTQKNMKKFLETPEAEEYYSSAKASEDAVRWRQKEGQYQQNQLLEDEFGEDTAEQMQMYTGRNDFLGDKDINRLSRIGYPSSPEQRMQFKKRLRDVQEKATKRMGLEQPGVAKHVVEAERPQRLEGSYEGWKELNKELPRERQGYGPNRFLRESLQGKSPWSNLYKTLTGKKKALRRDNTSTT